MGSARMPDGTIRPTFAGLRFEIDFTGTVVVTHEDGTSSEASVRPGDVINVLTEAELEELRQLSERHKRN